jgi:serine/threonine protein kinase
MSEPTRPNANALGFRVLCPHCNQPISCEDREPPKQLQCPSCRAILSPQNLLTVNYSALTRVQFDGPTPQPPAVPWPELADFEILEVIGQGGMGVVYRARDKRLQREVAIKMILPRRAADSDQWHQMLERFRREAEAVARLKHPNIVQIFTIGESSRNPRPAPSSSWNWSPAAAWRHG